ncbi:MAG: hypothetical protein KDK99_16500, partial [Verrucomicrobiales bacterium]|nr:hypothetical protein [Verrucomicrobiales bacterium]
MNPGKNEEQEEINDCFWNHEFTRISAVLGRSIAKRRWLVFEGDEVWAFPFVSEELPAGSGERMGREHSRVLLWI